MTTATMNTAEMTKFITESVGKLALKYEFDADEAVTSLDLARMFDGSEDSKGKGKGKGKGNGNGKGKGKAKDEGSSSDKKEKKKRAPTGYLLYSTNVRPGVKDTLTKALVDDEKLKPQLIISTIGAQWRALDQSQRDVWISKAKESAEAAAEDSD